MSCKICNIDHLGKGITYCLDAQRDLISRLSAELSVARNIILENRNLKTNITIPKEIKEYKVQCDLFSATVDIVKALSAVAGQESAGGNEYDLLYESSKCITQLRLDLEKR